MPVNLKLRLAIPPLALLLVLTTAFCAGRFSISPAELWTVLWSPASVRTDVGIVLWQIRLPRILAAILVGAALSVAGAAYQGMFRNPLVSPDILGVSMGAGLGAVLAIYFDLPIVLVQLAAFTGGLITVAAVYGIACFARHHSPVLALVLSGISIGALSSSGIMLIKILSDPYAQLPTITFWLLGGLNAVVIADIVHTAPVMLAGLVPLILLRWRMNLLSLDDDEAEAMGVHVTRFRIVFVLAATLMTAAAVSISGMIGWVGLVVPHIARLWVGPDFSRLLPSSLFIGAAFLLLTDTLTRTIAPIELPLGILTACIGAPFFLSLLIRGGRQP
jgi:iron complex transport system permease protein